MLSLEYLYVLFSSHFGSGTSTAASTGPVITIITVKSFSSLFCLRFKLHIRLIKLTDNGQLLYYDKADKIDTFCLCYVNPLAANDPSLYIYELYIHYVMCLQTKTCISRG